MVEAEITVVPFPQLVVRLFHERDVFSDDPFTDVVEPSLPFNLAVLVRNDGYGLARDFRIASAQPQIIENEKGLLVDFKIIATEVSGRNLLPSLTADFGDIEPGQTAIGRWLMTSTVQGLFIDYSATFEHVDGLGNPRLSLIDEVTIHEMNRLVQAGGDLEDGLPDFLVNDLADPADLPDTLYLSNGTTNSVAVVEEATHTGPPVEGKLRVELSASMPSGWAYLRVPEPSDGTYRLLRVERPDGSVLSLHTNVWTTDRTLIGLSRRPIRENKLHLLDYDSPGSYTLVYETPEIPDELAPSSQVNILPSSSRMGIAVSWSGQDDPGGSGVGAYDVFVSTNDGPFTRWIERTALTSSVFLGEMNNRYAFYTVAIDEAGNREPVPAQPDAVTTTSIVNQAPVIDPIGEQRVPEGGLLVLRVIAQDPEGDDITYTLDGGPTAMMMHTATGIITWPTTEMDGPQTNTITLRATDSGYPAQSTTAEVEIVVEEVNTAPVLREIESRIIREGQLLQFYVTAQDSDVPPQLLTYSLLGDTPYGMSIDPTSGLLTWRPANYQGGSTNLISVGVEDNGVPQLTDERTFAVLVRDSRPDFRLAIGSTNVLAGEWGMLPLTLDTEAGITNLTLALELDSSRLTNLTVEALAPEVTLADLVESSSNRFRLLISARSDYPLRGWLALARLGFLALPGEESEVVRLTPLELLGEAVDGNRLLAGQATGGKVFLIVEQPLVDASLGDDGLRDLTVYGLPGQHYSIESASSLSVGGGWQPVLSGQLTESHATHVLPEEPGPAIFYRAVLAPDAASDSVPTPRLQIRRLGRTLLLEWDPNEELQWTDALSSGWEDVPDAVSPFEVLPEHGARFYRLRRD
ncbi:MAG: hypothetical protein H7A46_09935 [Verrucomicrobiales bacterium]|nr:hypothetical protein [Verrucomicrobiales bacterium]